MTSKQDGGARKRVIVILGEIQPTAMSAADIADSVKTLASTFSVTIVTSTPEECARVFPGMRIVSLPAAPMRGRIQAFCVECWFALPFLKGDLIYVAGPEYTPAIATNIRKPVLCYGNANPTQHVMNTKRKGGLSSAILAQIYHLGMAVGLRRCDRILAISPQLKDVYTSLGVPSSSIDVLPLGVRLEDYDPSGRRRNGPGTGVCVGVYHGTMSKDRGLEIIIDGARILASKRRDFRIRLLGCRPPEEKMVRELATKAGVQDLFDILPPVPHDDIPAALWSADFGISLLEPNAYFATSPPVKVLEFLAAGLPVIANRIPTHALYLKDDSNALMIPYDAESFAEAMNTIIQERGLRARLSDGALKSVQGFSDLETHRALVESALELVRARG